MRPLPQPQMPTFQGPVAPMPEPQHEPVLEPEASPNGSGLVGKSNVAEEGDTSQEDDAFKNIGDTGENASDEASDTDPISNADLEDMLDVGEDAEPVTSIMDSGNNDEPRDAGIDIEDLPDPDPVPTMYSPNVSSGSKSQKRSIGKIIGIGFGVFLIALLAALFFARGMVMDLLPLTKGIYESIGLREEIGAGLKLSKPKIDYGTEKDKPILVVQGVITNVSEDPRPVPMLKVILRDPEKKDVQTTVAPPLRNELPAGERMRYKITVDNPSPRARSIAVIFVKPEDAKNK